MQKMVLQPKNNRRLNNLWLNNLWLNPSRRKPFQVNQLKPLLQQPTLRLCRKRQKRKQSFWSRAKCTRTQTNLTCWNKNTVRKNTTRWPSFTKIPLWILNQGKLFSAKYWPSAIKRCRLTSVLNLKALFPWTSLITLKRPKSAITSKCSLMRSRTRMAF